MEVQRQDDGKWHFALGPVERWIVGLIALAAGSLATWTVWTFDEQLEKQGETQQELLRAAAVTNEKLESIASQMANIPSLLQTTAQMRVQIDRNASDIRELQQEHRNRP